MPAFNGWYHCMSNTYGTWLPGDPRGFRTRKHREHVEGDYTSPPPEGKYEQRHEQARRNLKRPAVMLCPQARLTGLHAVLTALIHYHRVEVLSACVGAMHLHILARFGDVPAGEGQKPTPSRHGLRERDPARYFMGIAKERSAKSLAQQHLVAPGGVWATRGKIVPIKDRRHQVRVYGYILDHTDEGAAVWSYREGWPLDQSGS